MDQLTHVVPRWMIEAAVVAVSAVSGDEHELQERAGSSSPTQIVPARGSIRIGHAGLGQAMSCMVDTRKLR